jgi:hypothetical protein
VLLATENDDVGAFHDDDEERTYPAGLIVTVAPWSSSCRESVACAPVHVVTVAAGAESEPMWVPDTRCTSCNLLIFVEQCAEPVLPPDVVDLARCPGERS